MSDNTDFQTSLTLDTAVVIAAIDFGTTFSGYAFSFAGKPDVIHMNSNWGAQAGMSSYKTPTCVLTQVSEDGSKHTFLDFGYSAENNYVNRPAGEDPAVTQRICLFNKFKMKLHKSDEDDTAETITETEEESKPEVAPVAKIWDKRGTREAEAMTIFTMALRYIKDHLLKFLVVKGTPIGVENIRWVLTVPAIWSEESKAFMRRASHKAGLIGSENSENMRIALEPEAASLYCRGLDITHFETTGEDDVTLSPGTVYMIVDAGGGTVDITCHEVLENGEVNELIVATGGAWGGTNVDAALQEVLEDLWGKPFVKKLKQELPKLWWDIETRFEKSKREASPDSRQSLNLFSITVPMMAKYYEVAKKNIMNCCDDVKIPGVSLNPDDATIALNAAAVDGLFNPTVEDVIACIEELLEQPELNNIKYIFMVGGFSSSQYLVKAVKDSFSARVKVLIPDDPALAVLKGAVMFGQRPDCIRTRIARKTYGSGTQVNFVEGKHDPTKLIMVENVAKCKDVFVPFIKKNTAVELDDSVVKSFLPATSTATEINFEFYAANDENVSYIDERGVKKIGHVKIPLPNVDKGKNRLVEVKFFFGGTEIKVMVKDRSNPDGKEETIRIAFAAV